MTPHPRTPGVYGKAGTVEDYLDNQELAPFFDRNERLRIIVPANGRCPWKSSIRKSSVSARSAARPWIPQEQLLRSGSISMPQSPGPTDTRDLLGTEEAVDRRSKRSKRGGVKRGYAITFLATVCATDVAFRPSI